MQSIRNKIFIWILYRKLRRIGVCDLKTITITEGPFAGTYLIPRPFRATIIWFVLPLLTAFAVYYIRV